MSWLMFAGYGNLNKMLDLNIILNIIALVVLIAVAVLVVRSQATRLTISQQKELIDTLTRINEAYKAEIEELKALHLENTKAIAGLRGEVKTLKDVPLNKIMNGITIIEQTNKSIAETQGKIVDFINRETTK